MDTFAHIVLAAANEVAMMIARADDPAAALTAGESARAQFTALARFAEFSGTGAQTTHAFGATTTALIPAQTTEPAAQPPAATMTPTASA